ncbi:MAG: PHP domain-containing protein [Chloroflexi bacterium]|nr:PHP domain-containing protein [Chloroflexota bacterium]
MSALIDLHMHTTFSDGTLSPAELVRVLAATTLRLVAITDHDSLDGIAEAKRELANHPNLTLIPGIELSSDDGASEVHVLGYHLDENDPELHEVLAAFHRNREGRGELMVARLNEMGFDITWERVVEISQGGVIARPHIARALMEKGYVSEMSEAFDKYIGRGMPAHIEREKMTPEEAVALIRRFGGVPVLAHPTFTVDPPALVASLAKAGLIGMEVYYKNYTPDVVADLKSLADRHNLLALGGSDYHASGQSDEVPPGQVGPPEENGQRLLQMGPR